MIKSARRHAARIERRVRAGSDAGRIIPEVKSLNEREDYLDRLLRGVEDGPDGGDRGTEDDFFGDSDTFLDDGDDDFLKAFEKSRSDQKGPDGDDDDGLDGDGDLDFDMDFDMDDIDDIVSNVKNGMLGDEKDLPIDESIDDSGDEELDGIRTEFGAQEDDQDFMVNTMDEDDPDPQGTDGDGQDLMDMLSGLGEEDHAEDPLDSEEDDADLDIMARNLAAEIDELGLENDGDEDIMGADLGLEPELGAEEEEEDEDEGGKKGRKKKKKKEKGEKPGFFKRIATALFGEEEAAPGAVPEAGELENISDENMGILRDLAADENAQKEEAKAKKAQKKKEKEEKKAQKKKEKEEKKAQKAQAKAEKPKKEKKPKEPKPVVKTKPLPKGPVLMIWLVGISLVILVNLVSKQIGYVSSFSEAEEYYEQGDYVSAYTALPEEEDVKEPDLEMYEKARVTAYLQQPINSYRTYQGRKMYAEALSALIIGVGRYDKNAQAAAQAGAAVEYDKMLETITSELKKNYSMTADEARELYYIREKEDFTYAVYDVIKELGLDTEEE